MKTLVLSALSLMVFASAASAGTKPLPVVAPASVSPEVRQALRSQPIPADANAFVQDRTADTRAPNQAIDPRPGLIRPATRIADTQRTDDRHRGVACQDAKCKHYSPAYNTATVLEQEQGRLGGGY